MWTNETREETQTWNANVLPALDFSLDKVGTLVLRGFVAAKLSQHGIPVGVRIETIAVTSVKQTYCCDGRIEPRLALFINALE